MALLAPLLGVSGATFAYDRTDFAGQARMFASGRTFFPFSYRRTQFAFAPISSPGIEQALLGQVESAAQLPGIHTVEFDPFGGRVAAVPLSSSAFYARGALFWLLYATSWPVQADAAANLAWSTTTFATMQPYVSQYSYTGFVMLDLPDYLDSYYGSLLPALQAVKAKYDPTNFFTFPQNIPPS